MSGYTLLKGKPVSLGKFKISFRTLFAGGAIACLAILAGAHLIEYYLGIDACPLCILQRYVVAAMAVVFVIGALFNPQSIGRILYCSSIFLLGILGILLAGRHVWLQYAPHPAAATCTAGFENMLTFMPLLDVLKEVLTASSTCSQIDFTVFKLSLASWSLLFFFGLTLFSILIFSLQIKRRI